MSDPGLLQQALAGEQDLAGIDRLGQIVADPVPEGGLDRKSVV